jgi:hypothetical protein
VGVSRKEGGYMADKLSNHFPALKYGCYIDAGTGVDGSASNPSSIVINQAMPNGDSAKPLAINAVPTSLTTGARQGAEYISIVRAVGSALTAWDGNPDAALKIQARNNAVNGTNGGTRGMDVNARNTGSEAYIQGSYITVTNSSGTVADVNGGTFITDNGGVSTNVIPLIVQDTSQGSMTNSYGIQITTGTINPATGARSACIDFAVKDTAGYSEAFFFENGSGLEGAWETGTTAGAEAGYIKVKVGGTILRIKLWGNS